MKKIASTLLIGILLFNWFGYNLVVNYFQHQSDTHLESLLDQNQYDDTRLIELKIPLHLAYQSSWSSYERYDGELKVNDMIYKYVKRKVSEDTLYLMCLPNSYKMALETARTDFFTHTNDLDQNNSSNKSGNPKPSPFKNLVSEYEVHTFNISLNEQVNSHNYPPTFYVTNLLSSPHLSPEQPPDQSTV